MIVDTDVLIWYMKGNKKALTEIEKLPGFYISVVTWIELLQGMRNKKELSCLRRAMAEWQANVLYINEEISSRAAAYIERHFLSHKLHLADSLIAATGAIHNMLVLTGNHRHFSVIKDVRVVPFRA